MMDVNIVRSIVTLLSFVSFIAICVFAWSKASQAKFEAAARAVLDDEPFAADQVSQSKPDSACDIPMVAEERS